MWEHLASSHRQYDCWGQTGRHFVSLLPSRGVRLSVMWCFRVRLVQGQGRGDVAHPCRRFKRVCVFRWRPKKSFYPRDVLCFGLGWSLFWSLMNVVESYWCLAAWSLYWEVTIIRKPGGTSEDICFSANPLLFSLVFMTLELVGKKSFASLVFLFLFYVCEKTKI